MKHANANGLNQQGQKGISEGLFVTFWIADLLFGVDVKLVQEVRRQPETTPVPLAPSVVQGLINLRGQIATAVNMRRKLGYSDYTTEMHPMSIVLSRGSELMTLLVDRVGDVLTADQNSYEETPLSLPHNIRELIAAVHKFERHVMLVLDVDKACDLGIEGAA